MEVRVIFPFLPLFRRSHSLVFCLPSSLHGMTHHELDVIKLRKRSMTNCLQDGKSYIRKFFFFKFCLRVRTISFGVDSRQIFALLYVDLKIPSFVIVLKSEFDFSPHGNRTGTSFAGTRIYARHRIASGLKN